MNQSSITNHQSKALAIIPARMASTRLPGKPLLAETGKPLIQHVVEQVQQAQTLDRIIVATDDKRIAEAVQAFGGEAVMTREDHPNGTSRLAEVVQTLDLPPDELIVNVQGDEPEIQPDVIDTLVQVMYADDTVPMGTVAAPLTDVVDIQNPNIVKVVCDRRGRALYFSRSPIPYHRDPADSDAPPYLRHLGLYAYRCAFLAFYTDVPSTPAERAEQLEQLRALEHGYSIAVTQTSHTHSGIDTPEQYEAFVKRFRAR